MSFSIPLAGPPSSGSSSSSSHDLLTVLNLLSQRQSPDRLSLSSNKAVVSMIQKEFSPVEDSPFQVTFSDFIIKLNRKAKAQQRVLLVSGRAIYNLTENFKKVKRRIMIEKLAGITLVESTDDFALHVAEDYDYHYKSSRRGEIVALLAQLYKAIHNGKQELIVQVTDMANLHSLIRTKTAMQQQMGLNSTASALAAIMGRKDGSSSSSSSISSPMGMPSNSVSSPTLSAIAHHKGHSDSTDSSSSHSGSSLPFNMLRSLVSKKKIRFQEEGFDLDLTYVTERIIAMGFPSPDDTMEGLYRNPYTEVYKFMESRHRSHYKIYNLCCERQYQYESVKFNYRTASYGFFDHQVPTLLLMVQFCQDVQNFLCEDISNVVAIHCKAGKGRTGLMISCLLLFTGHCSSAESALTYFGNKRTLNGHGVTIPSQQRFVEYFQQFLTEYYSCNRMFEFSGHHFILTTVTIHTVPFIHAVHAEGSVELFFKIVASDIKTVLYDSRTHHAVEPFHPSRPTLIIPCMARIAAEVKFQFYFLVPSSLVTSGSASPISSIDKSRKLIPAFHFWIHSSFIPRQNPTISFPKSKLDKICKDKKNKAFDEHFKIELFFKHDEIYSEELEEGKDNSGGGAPPSFALNVGEAVNPLAASPAGPPTPTGVLPSVGFPTLSPSISSNSISPSAHSSVPQLADAARVVLALRQKIAELESKLEKVKKGEKRGSESLPVMQEEEESDMKGMETGDMESDGDGNEDVPPAPMNEEPEGQPPNSEED